MSEYVLEMRNITKKFPGVTALDNVTFRVKKGEIHALVGENGAGKSTLMKVLSGVYPYGTYEGEIILHEEVKKFTAIKDSEKAGIGIIYQELALVKQMSVCENIYLGNEFSEKGIIDWDKSFLAAQHVLDEVGLSVSPSSKVLNLGIGQQQLVEIAKALSKNTEVLILDEPTAALTEKEIEHLFMLLIKLKSAGVTCIYISHKLSEVFQIADTVTVLRDGKTIATDPVADVDETKIISRMVGREITQLFPERNNIIGETVLEVKNWIVYNPEIPDKLRINNVSFAVKKGEVLGVSGLMGAGRTELFMSIFGAYGVNNAGEIYLDRQKIIINSPQAAIKQGICYLSEDRKQYGIVPIMDVKNNVTLSSLERISTKNVINLNEEIRYTEHFVDELRIKTPSIEQKVGNLSGGNQQKVVLAKWLMANPKVLILDEPTRGIDVGAKYEIYSIINSLAEQGVSIIMISSELPEILGMSDRILVMHEGKINGELLQADATQEKVIFYATGGK